MLPSFNNLSLLSAAGVLSLSLSNLSLRACTSRGSHFRFDFYFPSQLNWPPEMWNFVKWDAPGEVTMPTCNLAVWRLSAERSKANDERERKKMRTKRNPRGNGLIRADGCMEIRVCVFLSVTGCVCPCLSMSVRASGGLLARGQGGSQDGFVRSQGQCCAPLGSRLLFQDATCWGMYSAHSFDGPSAQVH